MRESILTVENLSKNYQHKKTAFSRDQNIEAVKNVSFSVYPKESFGIIGESGCGKTTTANMLLRLIKPTSGKICFNGKDITHLSERKVRKFRKNIQIVFQHSNTVLDPKMTIEELLIEPLLIHKIVEKKAVDEKVDKLLEMVGISPLEKAKYPTAVSGGQIQRIIIARAIATQPQIIICDEPVSALDVSVQGQILNLFKKLKSELNISFIFITHDIQVASFFCDRIAVMYGGQIVEIGETSSVLGNPQNEYTKLLLESARLQK